MLKQFQNTILLLAKALVFLVCAGCFFLLFGQKNWFLLVPCRTSAITLVMFTVVYCLMTMVYGGFDIGKRKSKPIIFSHVLILLMTDVCAHFMLCIMNFTKVNNGHFVYEQPVLLLIVYLLQLLLVAILAYGCNDLYFYFNKPQRCLLVTRQGENVDAVMRKVGRFKKQYNIDDVAYIDDWDLLIKVDQHEVVFIYNLVESERDGLVEYCYQGRKDLYYSVEMVDIVSMGGHRVLFEDKSMIHAPVKGLSFEQRIIKRAMDIVIAAVGLLVASPILLVTAIAIKLEDGGPVFYRQKRATYGGRIFQVLKFRSMRVQGSVNRSATKDDDRITKVGRVIRKFRIDELPQLINVLKSDMSIVGPRPEMLENVEKYTAELPEFAYRLRAKAGLTGMAQIYGKYNTSPKDKLILDLTYIAQYSVWLDLKLILRTVLVLFTPDESTEGFDQKNDDKK